MIKYYNFANLDEGGCNVIPFLLLPPIKFILGWKQCDQIWGYTQFLAKFVTNFGIFSSWNTFTILNRPMFLKNLTIWSHWVGNKQQSNPHSEDGQFDYHSTCSA